MRAVVSAPSDLGSDKTKKNYTVGSWVHVHFSLDNQHRCKMNTCKTKWLQDETTAKQHRCMTKPFQTTSVQDETAAKNNIISGWNTCKKHSTDSVGLASTSKLATQTSQTAAIDGQGFTDSACCWLARCTVRDSTTGDWVINLCKSWSNSCH